LKMFNIRFSGIYLFSRFIFIYFVTELMPKLNFANHCYPSTTKWYSKYGYLVCPKIASHIRYCQNRGVKILLDIGGSKHFHIKIKSRAGAREFAKQIWNAFLGNTRYSPRTFGRYVNIIFIIISHMIYIFIYG